MSTQYKERFSAEVHAGGFQPGDLLFIDWNIGRLVLLGPMSRDAIRDVLLAKYRERHPRVKCFGSMFLVEFDLYTTVWHNANIVGWPMSAAHKPDVLSYDAVHNRVEYVLTIDGKPYCDPLREDVARGWVTGKLEFAPLELPVQQEGG